MARFRYIIITARREYIAAGGVSDTLAGMPATYPSTADRQNNVKGRGNEAG